MGSNPVRSKWLFRLFAAFSLWFRKLWPIERYQSAKSCTYGHLLVRKRSRVRIPSVTSLLEQTWKQPSVRRCPKALPPGLTEGCSSHRQTLFVRIVFFYWRKTWACQSSGPISANRRRSGNLDAVENLCTDFEKNFRVQTRAGGTPSGIGGISGKTRNHVPRAREIPRVNPMGKIWFFI